MINLLLILFQTMHLCLIIFEFFGPYYFNDSKILATLIILNILIVTQWYTFNACLLSSVEKSLGSINSYTYKNGTSKSFIAVFLENITGLDEMTVYYIFVLVPAVNTVVCLYKILNNCGSL